jgi:outer membrane receptor protein involved in Fe transport
MVTKNQLQPTSRLRPGAALDLTIKVTLLVILVLTWAAIHACNAQTNVLQGTVSVSSTSERLPGANLSLTLATPGKVTISAVTNDQGEYKFTNLVAGDYKLQVGLNGFKQHTDSVKVLAGVTTLNSIALEVEDVSANLTVVANGDDVNTTDAAPPVSFRHDTLQTVPLVNERFQDALPLVPGVVRGPDGLLNVKGARASQSSLTVNSSNVTDPVTGDFAINLPIEAIQSVEVLTNPYSPEYGEFTGAVTAVETKSGSEKFVVNAQSIFPRFRRRGGSFVGIEAFTPRVTFSGPLHGDKLKFIQSLNTALFAHL